MSSGDTTKQADRQPLPPVPAFTSVGEFGKNLSDAIRSWKRPGPYLPHFGLFALRHGVRDTMEQPVRVFDRLAVIAPHQVSLLQDDVRVLG